MALTNLSPVVELKVFRLVSNTPATLEDLFSRSPELCLAGISFLV